MAQVSTAPRLASLRATPGLLERIDLPRRVVFAAAASMILIVALLLVFIAWQGIQLFVRDGVPVGQILSPTWQPDRASGATNFGLLPFVAATVLVTAVALLISTPLSVGLAVFLSEVAPNWARAIVQPALEIFVGIPSVVWGWLGITILVPFLAHTFHGNAIIGLPVVGQIFSIPGFLTGFSWMAGSLVLSIMILPTITSVSYDAFRAVPLEMRTGSLALGTTRWQTIRHILIPSALPGVLTGVVLGMTRAAGEALAVQMVIGNSPTMPAAITQPVTTLTSQITLDMGNTVFGEPWQDALWTMSLVLLIVSITSVVLVRVINKGRMAT
ncbi:MAG TPA: phosphate ABC transporter permease subunit PstC [Candidatus Limnocylindrales bacterium]